VSLSAPRPLLPDALCCPDDGGSPLQPGEGFLACPRCGRRFPAQEGVLSLLPHSPGWSEADQRTVSDERSQRDREATRYDRLLGLRLLSLLELPATLGPLRVGAGDRVLEVGCGTGRMTVPLARTGAEIVAVDHSLESLRVLRGKLDGGAGERVRLVQGDASCLPVRSGWATRALTCQMLEHLPGEGMRARAVAELARALEPGALFAISAYRRLPFLPREGRHSGTIFFHRFGREEFRALLEPHFELSGLTGKLVYILLAHGTRRA
jgi:ubiquinone/menaquinone biosynthesis C-methylase UbiE/uncharacterized protein YbaR (Trm112 family)